MHRLSAKTLERKKDNFLRLHAMRRNLRTLLEKNGFVEIPTPIIRPAKGESPLLWNNVKCSLRPCMELQLRSALAYGLSSVYEIGSSFREGDKGPRHYPEFQLIETFSRDMSFEGMIALSQEMLNAALTRPISGFRRIDVSKTLQDHDPELDLSSPDAALLAYLKAKYSGDQEIQIAKYAYEAMNRLIEILVESSHPGSIVEPVMLWRYPRCTVCLAKPIDNENHLIQRAEFFIEGIEIGHGFVDDIDAEGVEERMLNNEPHHDADFLQLIKINRLPESAGVGFGLERLLMVDAKINDIHECIHEPCW